MFVRHIITNNIVSHRMFAQDQYVFIHDALLEAIECGVTEVAARDLPKQFRKLSDGVQLEEEFNKISSTLHSVIWKTAYAVGGNKSKNRYNDSKRVPCKSIP